jgi:hypothetical protein
MTNAIDPQVGEEALELSSAQAMLLHDAVVGIGDGDLEDVLCQINGGGSSMHVGLLSFVR